MPNGNVVEECTVGQFSARFARMIAAHRSLQRIAILGEITDIKRWPDGNLNMTLKEGGAVLACFSFASEARRFPTLREGLMVRAEGSIEVRPNRSLYQLRALSVTLVGAGKLAAEIEELRMRLRAEGAFDASRKRAIPSFPRRVALVTSDDDARADFEGRLRVDAPSVKLLFFRTRVQGKGAEIEIAEAIDRAAGANVDVIVLTRGGGSSEDRLTFNLEPVVRAILRSSRPVITALGHLKNLHLADEVADLALATPTAAAVHLGKEWLRATEIIERLNGALLRGYRSLMAGKSQQLRDSEGDLARAARDIMKHRIDRVREAQRQLDRRSPAARLADRRVRLERTAGSLDRLMDRRMERARSQLQRADALLAGADPTGPLARGFAIVTKEGVALRDVALLSLGDIISARLQRGTFEARVESVESE